MRASVTSISMRCSGPFEETRKCGIGRNRAEIPPPCHGVLVLLLWPALFTSASPMVASPAWRFSLRGWKSVGPHEFGQARGGVVRFSTSAAVRIQETRYGIQPRGFCDCQVSTRFRERASTRTAGSEYHVFALGHMRYGNGVVVATLITWDSADEGRGVLVGLGGGCWRTCFAHKQQ